MNRRVLILGSLVTLPLLGVLAFGLTRDPNQIESPLVGTRSPTFDLPVLDSDGSISSADLAGKPTVLNFWASWCVPCFAEHRVLVSAARELSPSVNFIGIIYQDEEENARRFLARFGSAYPSLIDEHGRTAIRFGVYGVPESFILDSSGNIVAKHVGPLDPESLRDYLEQAGLELGRP
ncbi:MAG: redoxin family protein [Acidobacteria bacterium]|nr:redoxin family protein [Acidobacteriota bacterium]